MRGVLAMKNLKKLSHKITAAAASAVMAVTSLGVSAPAVVNAADKNYYEALAMSLYMYDANACGSGISDGPLTWRGDCHTYDSTASVGSLDGSLKSAVDPDGDGKVDVSGGFHDAGDHIKFNLTIGFGISGLALSEYLNPGIYEKAGCKDHLIYELKWGADYLMKTTFLDGSGNVAAIAHVVANGGEDHAIWSSPEVQTYARPIYWLTANKNNSAVCCEMAAGLAGTAYIVKDSDPDYAAKCIKYAKALLEFGQKHVGNEGGGLADFYGTEAQYQDEEAMAQAWLWVCGEGEKPSRVPKNKDYGNAQYDGWVYCWNKVWQGYSALMYKATGDQAFADELKVELESQGDLKVGTYNADGWGASRYNCAKQMDAIALANGDPDAQYAKAAKYQMDHILGENSLGYSFLLGYGDKWPVHIHHRGANPGNDANGASSNPSAKYTAYGLLVGGDDKSGYQDQTDKYQYTEGALDYNGCFAIACAGIANLYGGDASAMTALAKSASEINADFKFGDNTPVVNTTTSPTTTVTTTTEETPVPTTTNIYDGSEFEMIVDREKISSGETATLTFKKGAHLIKFGRLEYDEDIISLEEKESGVYIIKPIKSGSARITFTAPTGQQKYVQIAVENSVDYGDANCDGQVDLSDVVIIMQALANPDKYGTSGSDTHHITERGTANADVNLKSGMTGDDALGIQKYLLGIYTSLPIREA